MFGQRSRKMITIELVPEDEQALAALAAEAGQSPAEFATAAVLQRLEDAEDFRKGVAALREFRDSGESAIPLEDVLRDHALEG